MNSQGQRPAQSKAGRSGKIFFVRRFFQAFPWLPTNTQRKVNKMRHFSSGQGFFFASDHEPFECCRTLRTSATSWPSFAWRTAPAVFVCDHDQVHCGAQLWPRARTPGGSWNKRFRTWKRRMPRTDANLQPLLASRLRLERLDILDTAPVPQHSFSNSKKKGASQVPDTIRANGM